MDKRNGLCRLLWACLNKWCAWNPTRHRSWCNDLHASSSFWKYQGLGNTIRLTLGLLWHRSGIHCPLFLCTLNVLESHKLLSKFCVVFAKWFTRFYSCFPCRNSVIHKVRRFCLLWRGRIISRSLHHSVHIKLTWLEIWTYCAEPESWSCRFFGSLSSYHIHISS